MNARIYYVSDNTSPAPGKLVLAKSRDQALKHVVMPRFRVELALPVTIAEMTKGGAVIESYAAQPVEGYLPVEAGVK